MTTAKKALSAYARAGVDIDAKMAMLRRVKRLIQSTATAGCAGEWGLFGGLFRAPGKDNILVGSADGVGTKIKVAALAGRHDTVGQDLVNHCVNDILAQGAEPLFFLDYIGSAKLDPRVFEQLIRGLCRACRENGCALIGGETAEMPGLYPEGEYDLVGTIVGLVPRARLITGRAVRPGDVLIGLHSSGLHTNGFSLARQIVFGAAHMDVRDLLPGTRRTIGDALLAVHRSYLAPVRALWRRKLPISALAHITGGGFSDNIGRFMPAGVTAVVNREAWKVPPLFSFLQESGRVDREEMYKVFNMGIGMIVIVRPQHAAAALAILAAAGEQPCVIGRMEKGRAAVRLIN